MACQSEVAGPTPPSHPTAHPGGGQLLPSPGDSPLGSHPWATQGGHPRVGVRGGGVPLGGSGVAPGGDGRAGAQKRRKAGHGGASPQAGGRWKTRRIA